MCFAVEVLHASLGGWWLAAPDDARCDGPQRCWQAGGSLQAASSCPGRCHRRAVCRCMRIGYACADRLRVCGQVTRVRTGYAYADSILSYPQANSLSVSLQPIRVSVNHARGAQII